MTYIIFKQALDLICKKIDNDCVNMHYNANKSFSFLTTSFAKSLDRMIMPDEPSRMTFIVSSTIVAGYNSKTNVVLLLFTSSLQTDITSEDYVKHFGDCGNKSTNHAHYSHQFLQPIKMIVNFPRMSSRSRNYNKSNRKAMNRNWSNQKAYPALKTKTGNK